MDNTCRWWVTSHWVARGDTSKYCRVETNWISCDLCFSMSSLCATTWRMTLETLAGTLVGVNRGCQRIFHVKVFLRNPLRYPMTW